jgi:hypothetical protein
MTVYSTEIKVCINDMRVKIELWTGLVFVELVMIVISKRKTGHSGIDSKLFHNSPTLHQMASYKSLITRLDRTRDSRVEGWLYRTFRHVREGQFEITIYKGPTF